MNNIANMTVAAIVDLYNGAIDDYGVNGFQPVDRFKSKAHAIERLEALCNAGNLAVTFDGDSAVIVDAMQNATGDSATGDGATGDSATGDSATGDSATGDGATGDSATGDSATGDSATGDSAAPAPIGAELSDAKGGIARSGFAYGSAEWLIANPRGTPAREAYRKARRLAARNMRKAARNAKLDAVTAE